MITALKKLVVAVSIVLAIATVGCAVGDTMQAYACDGGGE